MYEMGQEEADAVAAVLKSGQLFRYRGGENGECTQAERLLCEITGAKYSLIVTSGTGALICGLVGMGIGPGDEVIVPAFTWLASAGAILSVGAIPVLAEADESLTLDPEDFEKKITPRTKAVIPVHMGGRPCDMDRIKAIASKHGVRICEDACQAVGGSYKGKRVTSIGDCGAFSFNQFKNISCGEGGALITNDRRIHERALYYHDMGCTFRGHAGDMTEPAFMGNTYRMNEILGAVLRVQLGRLDSILARLRQRRDWFLDAVRAEKSPLVISPSADLEGDCGCNATFIFKTTEQRQKTSEHAWAIDKSCSLGSPIDSGLHVYTNWTVFLDQHCGHHPALNPYLMPANQGLRMKIDPECCKKTLGILARSGAMGIDISTPQEEYVRRAKILCQAAKEVIK